MPINYPFPEVDAFELIILVHLAIFVFAALLGLISYLFHSIGLYKIAKRRGIRHAWLAWFALGNMWILGSVSDQFRYVVKGKVCNRRKTLLWLTVAMIALVILLEFCVAVLQYPLLAGIYEAGNWRVFMPYIIAAGVLAIAVFVISIVAVVFEYIAYYDLFFSSNPDNATAFLVLGILFPVTLPFFVFSQRKRDYGMPPRKPVIPE